MDSSSKSKTQQELASLTVEIKTMDTNRSEEGQCQPDVAEKSKLLPDYLSQVFSDDWVNNPSIQGKELFSLWFNNICSKKTIFSG